MSLFKRHKSEESQATQCPRCSQIVGAGEGMTCPMCGWDLRDAYQGPTSGPSGQTTAPAGGDEPD